MNKKIKYFVIGLFSFFAFFTVTDVKAMTCRYYDDQFDVTIQIIDTNGSTDVKVYDGRQDKKTVPNKQSYYAEEPHTWPLDTKGYLKSLKGSCPSMYIYLDASMGQSTHHIYVGALDDPANSYYGLEVVYSASATTDPTPPITIATKCPGYTIPKGTIDGINKDVEINFAMKTDGSRVFYVDGTENKVDETIVSNKGRFYIDTASISKIFVQLNAAEVNNNHFSCPSSIDVEAGGTLFTDGTREVKITATASAGGNTPGGTTDPGQTPVDAIKYVKCGNIDRIPALLPKVFHIIFLLIKIAVPIGLIVLGMIDFAKAIISSEDDPTKKPKKSFFRRLMAAAVIFFIAFIVQILVGIVASNTDAESFTQCFQCFVNDDCEAYEEGTGPSVTPQS